MDALAELYLHLMTERMGPAGRIVDKTIDASRCLGLIACALPDAPLIWMRRDPLDCAWSCFRTFFIHGVAWSYDLADIARHFMLEDALLAFWAERLGDRLLVVPYGELVQLPALWTRRLLDHCGLAEEAGAFEPHKTHRVVATASSLQVRRPINRDGMNVAGRTARTCSRSSTPIAPTHEKPAPQGAAPFRRLLLPPCCDGDSAAMRPSARSPST